MKHLYILLMFVACFCGSVAAQDLPPDILADKYLLEATKALEEGKPQKAIAAFRKIEALDIEPPLVFHFFYGKLLVEHSTTTKDLLKGQSLLKKYVVRIEKESEHYTPTLELLSLVEEKIEKAKQEAKRLEEAKRKAEAKKREEAKRLEEAKRKSEAAKALHGENPTFMLPGGASLKMIWIEPGTFMMGSPYSEPERSSDEGPVHEVTISVGFWLGKYEVTQGQWEAVMGTRPWEGKSYVRNGSDYPAVYVSWNDAQAFIGRLNEAAGSAVYSLPTEAEWEYACRAGTTTRWSFGNNESQLTFYAWYSANAWAVGEDYAHRVGTKRANPWGLYDMHGNVWEWVQDWYDGNYYGRSASVDPTGPSTGSFRLFRGGGFRHDGQNGRSANRNDYSPDSRFNGFGFRVLRRVN